MIQVPSRRTTGRSLGEIERHDRNVLGRDVVPDVELGPVRQRKDADRSRPGRIRVLNRFHSSGRWLRGSQTWLAPRNEKMRSLARLFSSSRRAPPNAASNCDLSSACFSASVFITWVCSAEPEAIGLMPRASAVLVDVDDQIERRAAARSRRETRSSRGTSRSCRRAAAETAAWPG